MEVLNFEQMEEIQGGNATYSTMCSVLFTGWGMVLGYGAMSMGPVGWVVGSAWAVTGLFVCGAA